MRWVANRGRAEYDANGAPVRVLGIGHDITERKQAEDALRANERFLTRLLETAPLVIYLFDAARGQTLYASSCAATSLGYDAMDALNVSAPEFMAQVMYPEDRVKLEAHFEQLATSRDGDISDYASRMRHRNGEWRLVP